jgi:hypothetical protein
MNNEDWFNRAGDKSGSIDLDLDYPSPNRSNKLFQTFLNVKPKPGSQYQSVSRITLRDGNKGRSERNIMMATASTLESRYSQKKSELSK